jgi:hypothetical protein
MTPHVDLPADLNARDEDDLCWTFLDEASDPSIVRPGAVVVAGESRAAALVEIVDEVELGTGTIVRFRILPGRLEEYAVTLHRAGISL